MYSHSMERKRVGFGAFAASLLIAVVVTAGPLTGSAMAQDAASSARSQAKTAHCKRGKVAVLRGKVKTCLKTPRNAATTKPPRSKPGVRAAWYDTNGAWHTDGKLHYVQRWPATGSYRASDGRYYYVDQWTETAGYNLSTLYVYRYWTATGWKWWGDYQCRGLNNGVYGSDACYWFPAR